MNEKLLDCCLSRCPAPYVLYPKWSRCLVRPLGCKISSRYNNWHLIPCFLFLALHHKQGKYTSRGEMPRLGLAEDLPRGTRRRLRQDRRQVFMSRWVRLHTVLNVSFIVFGWFCPWPINYLLWHLSGLSGCLDSAITYWCQVASHHHSLFSIADSIFIRWTHMISHFIKTFDPCADALI